ncbi:MAG TPA: DegT/DnrJ/EryC1/StrS family aminotransferase, partial [Acidimicrobiia bacterium]|nr:DegT/DnrJ/EryC1/StrS family aminotransferase [Acidimicrobiia bacterium]
GPMVARLEALGAAMAGTRHAVAVSNGTVTLETAFEVLGLGPGDEVITTPFTFAATVNAALRSGATVRFADITADFTIDPDAVAALAGERTAAIVPVHLYGLMADMPALMILADHYGAAVVEDAAQAHGASFDGRRAGSFGIGSFSFYATKNVAAGEGGLLTTNDDDTAHQFRLLRNQGMVERYRYEAVGRNLRMTDLQAALAVPQLERLDESNAARQANAARLTDLLGGHAGLGLPDVPKGREHVWHQYTVLLPEGADRDVVQARMREVGVEAGVYYPRLAWDYPIYRDHPQIVRDDTPVARSVTARCLSLPVHPRLRPEELEQVAVALLGALETTI